MGQGGLLMYWKNVRLNHLDIKDQAIAGTKVESRTYLSSARMTQS
jgi:hypothetical protein